MLVTYAVLLLAACSSLFFLRDLVSLIGVILVVIFPIITYIIAMVTAHKLDVTITPPYYIVVTKNPVILKITLQNKTHFPISCVSLKLVSQNSFAIQGVKTNSETISAQIVPHGIVELNVTVTSPHCGNVRVEMQNIKVYDFFRLTYCTCKVFGDAVTVTNLPPMLRPNEGVPISDSDTEDSNIYSTQRGGDDTSQVFDYHEYAPGDRIKNINWKLSSRMKELMIKEFSFPISNSTLIMPELNATTYEEIDDIMSAFCWVSHWLLDNQCTYTMRWIQSLDMRENNQIIDPATDNSFTLLSIFQQLYSGAVYQENYLLDGYKNGVLFSNIIYVVHTVSPQMLEKLFEISLKSNLTVICHIQKKSEELLSLQEELEMHGIKFMLL